VSDVDIGQDVPQEKVPATMAGVDLSDQQKSFFQHLFDYSYPSIVETPDGIMHMTYTFRRRTIKYATFDESWIKKRRYIGSFHWRPPIGAVSFRESEKQSSPVAVLS
jgi:hypothetical protein